MSGEMMNMSLDEIIQKKGKGGRGGRGEKEKKGRGSFTYRGEKTTTIAKPRREGRPNTAAGRIRAAKQDADSMEVEASYPRAPHPKGNPDGDWSHDLYDVRGSAGGKRGSKVVIQTGTKIHVTGLNYDIMDADLRDVFKQYGDVKLAQVRYDKTDRSTGEGEVIFSTEEDAAKAYKELNGAIVNGQTITLRFLPGGSTGPKHSSSDETTTTTSTGAAGAPLRVVTSSDGQRNVRIGGANRDRVVTASSGSKFGTGAGFLGTVLAGNRVTSVVSTPGSIRKGTGRTTTRGRGRRTRF